MTNDKLRTFFAEERSPQYFIAPYNYLWGCFFQTKYPKRYLKKHYFKTLCIFYSTQLLRIMFLLEKSRKGDMKKLEYNSRLQFKQFSMHVIQAYGSYKVSISLGGICCPDSHHIQNFLSAFLQLSSPSISFLVVYTFVG